ncbi:hypothetical protein Tsubulata_050691 [Turnera subulata]|uniref:Uncharacterized protein n=1 Tax=Turnera subulata TaxID=218843 RepID=A0A9Q0G2H8_9ROSI|nr:hypothetical protein Tsubulata_050691 [Turnera subulata]
MFNAAKFAGGALRRFAGSAMGIAVGFLAVDDLRRIFFPAGITSVQAQQIAEQINKNTEAFTQMHEEFVEALYNATVRNDGEALNRTDQKKNA